MLFFSLRDRLSVFFTPALSIDLNPIEILRGWPMRSFIYLLAISKYDNYKIVAGEKNNKEYGYFSSGRSKDSILVVFYIKVDGI